MDGEKKTTNRDEAESDKFLFQLYGELGMSAKDADVSTNWTLKECVYI